MQPEEYRNDIHQMQPDEAALADIVSDQSGLRRAQTIKDLLSNAYYNEIEREIAPGLILKLKEAEIFFDQKAQKGYVIELSLNGGMLSTTHVDLDGNIRGGDTNLYIPHKVQNTTHLELLLKGLQK